MTITELITNLNVILEDKGDLRVEVRNPAGDFDILDGFAVECPSYQLYPPVLRLEP